MTPDGGAAAALGAAGPFNLFQRLMLRWRELHPYNPVHVLRVPLALDAGRLREGIAAQLEARGLTGLAVDLGRWRYAYEGGPAQVELRIVDADGDADGALARTIEEEFNRSFVPGQRENPFRFVAIDEQGAAFRLALVYDHYVAGGESIARLLTELARALMRDDAAPTPVPAMTDAARYRHALLRHPGWMLRAMLGLPRMIGQTRRACRANCESADRANAYRGLSLGAAQTQALRAAAVDWGVTLHELLTACLLLALSPLVPRRDGQARRNELAVASIMNMRRDLRPELRDGLSPFLAAYRVSHRVPEGIGLRQLAGDVHQQTLRIKRDHLYLQSLPGLALSALLWPLLTPRQRYDFYPKHFPLQAGVSSIDLNRLWADGDRAWTRQLDYLRAVPTGPLCPLVLAATSVHDRLHLGIAFRTSAFSREAVERLAAELMRQTSLAAPGATS